MKNMKKMMFLACCASIGLALVVWELSMPSSIFSRPSSQCQTICFRSPQFFLRHLTSLPPGAAIEVGGSNFNTPTSNLTTIKSALRGGSSELEQLNQQFVAAQLSITMAGGYLSATSPGVLQSHLRCFSLSLGSMKLSNGVTLDQDSTLDSLFKQSRLAIRENRTADLLVLARLFGLLNGNDPTGRCGNPGDRQLLPDQMPVAHAQEFTGPEAGFPPQPKGRTNITKVPFEEGPLTDALEAQIRQAAVQDARVRNLLGNRFAYLSTNEVEPDKDRPRDPAAPLLTRVVFFSHTNSVAVEARLRGLQVESASAIPESQPPVGVEEIDEAVALARKDPRLLERVQGLTGEAILFFPSNTDQSTIPTQPTDHRLLYVSFSRDEEDQTLFFAIVDLTTQRVIAAGSAAEK